LSSDHLALCIVQCVESISSPAPDNIGSCVLDGITHTFMRYSIKYFMSLFLKRGYTEFANAN
jgi:hypothetical protein